MNSSRQLNTRLVINQRVFGPKISLSYRLLEAARRGLPFPVLLPTEGQPAAAWIKNLATEVLNANPLKLLWLAGEVPLSLYMALRPARFTTGAVAWQGDQLQAEAAEARLLLDLHQALISRQPDLLGGWNPETETLGTWLGALVARQLPPPPLPSRGCKILPFPTPRTAEIIPFPAQNQLRKAS